MNEKSMIPPAWQVPKIFRERMGAKVGRQRAMVADGHLLLVLHAPPKGERERIGRLFWRSPDGSWTSDQLGTGINALQHHLGEFEDVISQLARMEEEAAAAGDYLIVLEQLIPMQRAARNLHHVLQESREAHPGHRELIDARDRAYAIERTADLLFSETKSSLDVLVAKEAEAQSRSSRQMAVAAHRLNLLAAFFLPIVTLTTIFGTNLQHGFEHSFAPLPFLALVAGGLTLGLILTLLVTYPSNATPKAR